MRRALIGVYTRTQLHAQQAMSAGSTMPFSKQACICQTEFSTVLSYNLAQQQQQTKGKCKLEMQSQRKEGLRIK